MACVWVGVDVVVTVLVWGVQVEAKQLWDIALVSKDRANMLLCVVSYRPTPPFVTSHLACVHVCACARARVLPCRYGMQKLGLVALKEVRLLRVCACWPGVCRPTQS